MKMDRNENLDGVGKYAIINLRKLTEKCDGGTFRRWSPEVEQALNILESVGVLEWGRTGEADEFFLIKLKDKHAQAPLFAYAASAKVEDPEWAEEIEELARRSGPAHPLCKTPD